MKPGAPPAGGVRQVVQQKAQQAAQDVKQGVKDEARNVLADVASQVTGAEKTVQPQGAEGIGATNPQLPDHNQYAEAEAYKQRLEAETKQRMSHLKSLLEQEMQKARYQREQKAQQAAQAVYQQMQAGKPQQDEEGGFMATISRAAKRVKGRLGQIGKGKSEKGKAAKG